MATRDRYDMNILNALQKIATSLDKIEKILKDKSIPSLSIKSNENCDKNLVEVTRCENCRFYISEDK